MARRVRIPNIDGLDESLQKIAAYLLKLEGLLVGCPDQQEGQKNDEEARKIVLHIKHCHKNRDRTDEKIVKHVRTRTPRVASALLTVATLIILIAQ